MTEVARFFDTVLYGEGDQAEVQASQWRDGVIQGYGSELAVSSGGAGFANVADGQAFVQGFWYKNTATKTLAITPNASATARVDLVVLRLDRVANTLVAAIHDGVVGGGAPVLTQIVGGTWEIRLATLSTASSVTTFTDTRQWQSNMFNPMTTSQDIIIADAQGRPIRKAKGANNTILSVDGTGNLAYQQLLDAMIALGTIHGNKLQSNTVGSAQITDRSIAAIDVILGALSYAELAANAASSVVIGTGFNSAGISNGPWTWMHASAQVSVFPQGGPVMIILVGYMQNNTVNTASYVGIGQNTNTAVSGIIQVGHHAGANYLIPFCLVNMFPSGTAAASYYGVGGCSGGVVSYASTQMVGIEFRR